MDPTKTALLKLGEVHPAEYLAWLTLWIALGVFTVRTIAQDLFGEPPVKDAELRRFRAWERISKAVNKNNSQD
jgi:hypothetical protein